MKIRVDSIEWKQVLLKEDIFGKEKFLFEAKEDITFGAKFEAYALGSNSYLCALKAKA